MAFSHITDQDVYDLRDALDNLQDEEGHSEFIEGALAVCAWLTEPATKPSVENFLKANDLP